MAADESQEAVPSPGWGTEAWARLEGYQPDLAAHGVIQLYEQEQEAGAAALEGANLFPLALAGNASTVDNNGKVVEHEYLLVRIDPLDGTIIDGQDSVCLFTTENGKPVNVAPGLRGAAVDYLINMAQDQAAHGLLQDMEHPGESVKYQ